MSDNNDKNPAGVVPVGFTTDDYNPEFSFLNEKKGEIWHDWDAVKKLWFAKNLEVDREEPYSHAQLAQDTGVPYGSIRNRASKEGWTDELKRRKAERTEKALDEIKSNESLNEIKLRRRQMSVGRYITAKGIQRLQQLAEAELTPSEAIKLVVEGTRIEREAAGLRSGVDVFLQAEDEVLSVDERKKRREELQDTGRRLVEWLRESKSEIIEVATDKKDEVEGE